MPGDCIITTRTSSLTTHIFASRTSRFTRPYHRLRSIIQRKPFHRRAVRIGLLTSNLVILALITGFVLNNSTGNASTPAPAILSEEPTSVASPLDQVSSTDIALTVALLDSLPEATAITNQAQSQAAETAMTASSDTVVDKPQVVATALKSSADIQAYTTKANDTVSSLAAQYGVTSDSIRWSNDLHGDAIPTGTTLKIPPVNGIVYIVQAGDTPDSLATKFQANKDKIIAYNDAEIKGLAVGQQIIIPDAIKVTVTRAAYSSNSAGFPWGGYSPVYNGSNGYDWGYCTWYVAKELGNVPSNWGNANTWAYYAARSGWDVSVTPSVGAIAQTSAGAEGHVAIVEWVSDDGTQMRYRDMNGIAGFGNEGHSGIVSASKFQHYISP